MRAVLRLTTTAMIAVSMSLFAAPVLAAERISAEARAILAKNAELKGKTPGLSCEYVLEEVTHRRDGSVAEHKRSRGSLIAKGSARFVRETRWSASGGLVDSEDATTTKEGYEWLITDDEIAYRDRNKYGIVQGASFEVEEPLMSLANWYFGYIEETVFDRVWSSGDRRLYAADFETICVAEDRMADASTVGELVRVSLVPVSDDDPESNIEADFDPAHDYALVSWRTKPKGMVGWETETEITYSDIGGFHLPTRCTTTTRSDRTAKALSVRSMELTNVLLTPDMKISLRNFETPDAPNPPIHFQHLDRRDGKVWVKMGGGPVVDLEKKAAGTE